MLTGIGDVLSIVREEVADDLPFYSDALEGALKSVNPVFVREEYAEFFWNCAKTLPGWIQTVFVQSAVAESIGSKNIFSYWQSVHGNEEAETGLLLHARDEARHSRIFLALVDLAFPEFLPAEDRRDIENSLNIIPANPQKRSTAIPEPILLNYLASVNIAEIRTLINLHLLGPIFYSFASDKNKNKVMKLLQSLQKDEVTHISYTAALINSAGRDTGGLPLEEMYKKSLSEFSEYSRRGLEDAVERYGGGPFLRLIRRE
jgi:hypothetical protein